MALAGHPRAMKMAIFTPGPPATRGAATSGHEKGGSQRSRRGLFSGEGPPRPGATSGHENRAGQQRQRQLFSDEWSPRRAATIPRENRAGQER